MLNPRRSRRGDSLGKSSTPTSLSLLTDQQQQQQQQQLNSNNIGSSNSSNSSSSSNQSSPASNNKSPLSSPTFSSPLSPVVGSSSFLSGDQVLLTPGGSSPIPSQLPPPHSDDIITLNSPSLTSSNDSIMMIKQPQQQQQLQPQQLQPHSQSSSPNKVSPRGGGVGVGVGVVLPPSAISSTKTISPRSMSTPNIHSIPLNSSPSILATPRHNQREIPLSPSHHKLFTSSPSKQQYFNRNNNNGTNNQTSIENNNSSTSSSSSILKKQQTRKGSLGSISFTSYKASQFTPVQQQQQQQQKQQDDSIITESEDDVEEELEEVEVDDEDIDYEEYSDDTDTSDKEQVKTAVAADQQKGKSPTIQSQSSPPLHTTTTVTATQQHHHSPSQQRSKSHSTLGIVTGPTNTTSTTGFISPRRSSQGQHSLSQASSWSNRDSTTTSITNIAELKKKTSQLVLEDSEDSVQLGSSSEFDEQIKSSLKQQYQQQPLSDRPLVIHPIHNPSNRNSDGTFKSQKHPLSRVSSAPVIQGPMGQRLPLLAFNSSSSSSSSVNTSPHKPTINKKDDDQINNTISQQQQQQQQSIDDVTNDQYYLIPKEKYYEWMEFMNLPDIQMALKQRQLQQQQQQQVHQPVQQVQLQQQQIPQSPSPSPSSPSSHPKTISKSSRMNFVSLDLEFHTHRKKSLSQDLGTPTTTPTAGNIPSGFVGISHQQQPIPAPIEKNENPVPTSQYKSQAHPLISRKSTSYLFEKTKQPLHLVDRSHLHIDLNLKSPLSSPSPSPREKLADKELESINEKKKERPSSIRKRQDPLLSPSSLVSPSITPRLKNTRQSPSSIDNASPPSSLSPEQRFLQQSPSPAFNPPLPLSPSQSSISPRSKNDFSIDQQQPLTPTTTPTSHPRGIVRKLSTTAIHKLVNLPTLPPSQGSILISPRKYQIPNATLINNYDDLNREGNNIYQQQQIPPLPTHHHLHYPQLYQPIFNNNNGTNVHDIIEPSHHASLDGKILSSNKQKNEPFMVAHLPAGKTLTFTILSNHDDNHFVGLSGIDIFDGNGSFIKLNELKTKIKADVLTDQNDENRYGYGYDPRTIERIIDEVPRTCDDTHQWLAPFTKDQSITITITFDNPIIISLIRIWNYNKSRIYTYRGIKNIEIKLDNVLIFKGSIKKAQGTLHSCDECAEYIVFTNEETTLQSIEQNDPYSPSIYQQQLQQAELLEAFNNNNNNNNQENGGASNGAGGSGGGSRDGDSFKELQEKQNWTELQEHYSKVQLDKDGRPMTSALSYNPLMMKQILHSPSIMSTANQINNNNSSNHHYQNFVYPKGSKLKFQFQSTWGDKFYLGLTGIDVFDHNYQLIRIGIKNITASPRDINQAGHTGDYRTLDKLVDGQNITMNDQHMWLIPFSSQPEHPTLTIDLGQVYTVSCIRVYNYNKSADDSSRGAKNVTISLDGVDLSPQDGFIFRKAPGIVDFDFGQIISFANFDKLSQQQQPPPTPPPSHHDFQRDTTTSRPNLKEIPQDYKSTFLPCGFIFKMVILSTHGDKTKVGLNGIELFDQDGNLIKTNNNIIDLNDPNNQTIFRLLDGVNSSFDENHMWITNFNHPIYSCLNSNNSSSNSRQSNLNSICIYFDHPISLSMVKIWNFSKSASRGVEDFELFMDDILIFKGKLSPTTIVQNTVTPDNNSNNNNISIPDFSQTILFNPCEASSSSLNINYCNILNPVANYLLQEKQHVQFINNNQLVHI